MSLSRVKAYQQAQKVNLRLRGIEALITMERWTLAREMWAELNEHTQRLGATVGAEQAAPFQHHVPNRDGQ